MPPSLPPSDPTPTGVPAELALLHHTVERLTDELAGLRRAMASRAEIDQAKGVLRALTGLSGDEAFALLSRRSQHSNRKLVEIAREVLARVEPPAPTNGPTNGPAVVAAVGPAVGAQVPPEPAPDPGPPPRWRSRRSWDANLTSVTDPDQLRALADMGHLLAGAGSEEHLTEILLGPAPEALGAYGGAVASLSGTGRLAVTHTGHDRSGLPGDGAELDRGSPHGEVLHHGRPVLLGNRAEVAVRLPAGRAPGRLEAIAVLPLGPEPAAFGVWELCFDQPLDVDRSTRAMLATAARMASGAVYRAG